MEKIFCCNIWKKECYVVVKNTEKLCPLCNGHGGFFVSAHFKQRYFTIKVCSLCKGVGKVDWITYITRPLVRRLRWIHHTKEIPIKCPRNKACKKLKILFYEQNKKEGMPKNG